MVDLKLCALNRRNLAGTKNCFLEPAPKMSSTQEFGVLRDFFGAVPPEATGWEPVSVLLFSNCSDFLVQNDYFFTTFEGNANKMT